jgi:hypothetical protein
MDREGLWFAKTLQVPLQFLADLEGPRSMTASQKKQDPPKLLADLPWTAKV